MELMDAAAIRHSVRQYSERPIESEIVEKLRAEIDSVNKESGMNITLVLNEPKAFNGALLKTLTKFKNAVNYIAMIGPNDGSLNEKAGYWGERIVLYAQTLGLNTCWAMMAKKKQSTKNLVKEGEACAILISVGYGATDGHEHRNKPISEIADLEGKPEWFVKGVECAMLAPTGMNRQNFRFDLEEGKVKFKGGSNALGEIDNGIVKFHFELGAGKENFEWL